jgi:hypothetical protein
MLRLAGKISLNNQLLFLIQYLSIFEGIKQHYGEFFYKRTWSGK